jgi:hypothetical protein
MATVGLAIYATLAWFTSNPEVESGGASMVAASVMSLDVEVPDLKDVEFEKYEGQRGRCFCPKFCLDKQSTLKCEPACICDAVCNEGQECEITCICEPANCLNNRPCKDDCNCRLACTDEKCNTPFYFDIFGENDFFYFGATNAGALKFTVDFLKIDIDRGVGRVNFDEDLPNGTGDDADYSHIKQHFTWRLIKATGRETDGKPILDYTVQRGPGNTAFVEGDFVLRIIFLNETSYATWLDNDATNEYNAFKYSHPLYMNSSFHFFISIGLEVV